MKTPLLKGLIIVLIALTQLSCSSGAGKFNILKKIPKVSLPKISMPKISMPSISMPEMSGLKGKKFSDFTSNIPRFTATRINRDNPDIQAEQGAPAATVYFLRPYTERAMGFPDNVLMVDSSDSRLLSIVKGEYTMAQLIPGTLTLTARNPSTQGPKQAIVEMTKSSTFDFEEDATYYVLLQPTDGEFRGVFFKPQLISSYDAKTIAQRLRAQGISRKQRIPKPIQ